METLAPPAVALPDPAPLADPDPVLLEAARLLREGWGQGRYRLKPPFYLRLLGAKPRYCLIGAISEAGRLTINFPGYLPSASLPYIEALGFKHPNDALRWNDAEERTQEEVVERVERAAYGL